MGNCVKERILLEISLVVCSKHFNGEGFAPAFLVEYHPPLSLLHFLVKSKACEQMTILNENDINHMTLTMVSPVSPFGLFLIICFKVAL